MILPHAKEIIDSYVKYRTHPGSGFYTILSNDLFGAFGHCDSTIRDNMHDIIKYIYNDDSVPCVCWGSKEAVKKWLSRDNE